MSDEAQYKAAIQVWMESAAQAQAWLRAAVWQIRVRSLENDGMWTGEAPPESYEVRIEIRPREGHTLSADRDGLIEALGVTPIGFLEVKEARELTSTPNILDIVLRLG